jgi:hypothetical protein
MKSKFLIAALALPIVVFAGLTAYNEFLSRNYTEYKFPIEAFDPRDYLSGNYLRFRIKYPFETSCTENQRRVQLFACLKPVQQLMGESDLPNCQEWIPGNCNGSQFVDNLDRFYIPESKATKLERAVFGKQGTIVLSVGPGHVIIKDLLIDGRSWKEF